MLKYAAFCVAMLSAACSAKSGDGYGVTQNTGTGTGGLNLGTGGSSTSGGLAIGATNSGGGTDSGDGDTVQITTTLPDGFTATQIGGYQLGEPLDGTTGDTAGDDGSGKCGNILRAVVRDFKGKSLAGGHPDFEAELYGNDITPRLVQTFLGADHKPVYVPLCEQGTAQQNAQCPFGPETTSKTNFDEWYRFTPDVNKPHIVKLWFAPQAGGLYTFQSLYFFPIDGGGFMDSATADDGKAHNFSFTTELHTKFQYAGGETFTFDGDDDVWVFVNGKLAVDVGGLHPAKSGSVSLDASATELEITPGQVYALDLFHAERHTPASTFRIDTNLSFVDCGSLPDDVVK